MIVLTMSSRRATSASRLSRANRHQYQGEHEGDEQAEAGYGGGGEAFELSRLGGAFPLEPIAKRPRYRSGSWVWMNLTGGGAKPHKESNGAAALGTWAPQNWQAGSPAATFEPQLPQVAGGGIRRPSMVPSD